MATKTERKRRAQKREQNLAKAMSHKDRADALKIFNERTASTNEVAKELGLDVRKLGYHVRKLHELGCIEVVDTQRVRGALETFYCATAKPIVYSEDWDEIPEDRRPALIGEFTQAIIDNVVCSVNAGVLGKDGDFWIGPTPVVTDRQGLKKLVAFHEALNEKALEVQADYAERKANGEAGDPIDIVSAQACFPVSPLSKKR